TWRIASRCGRMRAWQSGSRWWGGLKSGPAATGPAGGARVPGNVPALRAIVSGCRRGACPAPAGRSAPRGNAGDVIALGVIGATRLVHHEHIALAVHLGVVGEGPHRQVADDV